MAADPRALPAEVAAAVRAELGDVAEATVQEIIVEVPSYAEEFTGHMRKECHDSSIDYQLISTSTPLDRALASYLSWRE